MSKWTLLLFFLFLISFLMLAHWTWTSLDHCYIKTSLSDNYWLLPPSPWWSYLTRLVDDIVWLWTTLGFIALPMTSLWPGTPWMILPIQNRYPFDVFLCWRGCEFWLVVFIEKIFTRESFGLIFGLVKTNGYGIFQCVWRRITNSKATMLLLKRQALA